MTTSPQSESAAKKDVSKLQRAIVDGLEDIKAQDIQVFDTEHLSPLFERVIVASGTSNRQTKAIAASVRDKVREAGFPKPRIEGQDNGEWIIVDCGAAVAHIMQPTIRQYYRLEELWGEKPVRVKLGAPKPTAPTAKVPVKTAARRAAKAEAEAQAADPAAVPARKAPGRTRTAAAAPAAAKAPARKPAARKSAAAPARLSAPVKKAPARSAAATAAVAKAPAKSAATKTAAKVGAKAPVKTAIKTVVVKPRATTPSPAKKSDPRSAAKAPAKAPARKSSAAPATRKPKA